MLTRLETLYAVAYSFGGIPLVYMGDELALRSDADWAADASHADDNRWLHRPVMDWAAADRRTDPATTEGRVFSALQRLAVARASTEALRSDGTTTVLQPHSPHVLAYVRTHPRAAPVLGLACFADTEQLVEHGLLEQAGIHTPVLLHSTTGRLDLRDGMIRLPPWGFAWITTP